MKKRIGRPKVDPAFKLATKAWFNYVSISLERSAGQLEALFTTSDNDKKYRRGDRPKLWDRYRNGAVSPRIKGTAKKLSIVEKVDDALPGASKWLTSSFWRLLSLEPMDMDDLRGVYLSLHPTIRSLFVIDGYNGSDLFWRVQSHPKDLMAQLLSDRFGDLNDIQLMEVATAILALAREAEIKQDIQQHIEALYGWQDFHHLLVNIGPFHNILDDIDHLVKKRYYSVRYFLDGTPHKWKITPRNKPTLALERAPHQLPMVFRCIGG